jgi:hypothetical protein
MLEKLFTAAEADTHTPPLQKYLADVEKYLAGIKKYLAKYFARSANQSPSYAEYPR